MYNMQIFKNTEFGELEVSVVDGKEIFPATDCARILGYSNPEKAIRDQWKGVNEILTPLDSSIIWSPPTENRRIILNPKMGSVRRRHRYVS